MALYYLETSALVKLYVREPGTERLLRLATAREAHRFAILALSQVELRSAVRRRERAADIGKKLAVQILDRFELNLAIRFLRQAVSDAVIDVASTLIDRHPLRAYDALQLAGCLVLRSTASEKPVFICADQTLLKAAEAEGLALIDPTE